MRFVCAVLSATRRRFDASPAALRPGGVVGRPGARVAGRAATGGRARAGRARGRGARRHAADRRALFVFALAPALPPLPLPLAAAAAARPPLPALPALAPAAAAAGRAPHRLWLARRAHRGRGCQRARALLHGRHAGASDALGQPARRVASSSIAGRRAGRAARAAAAAPRSTRAPDRAAARPAASWCWTPSRTRGSARGGGCLALPTLEGALALVEAGKAHAVALERRGEFEGLAPSPPAPAAAAAAAAAVAVAAAAAVAVAACASGLLAHAEPLTPNGRACCATRLTHKYHNDHALAYRPHCQNHRRTTHGCEKGRKHEHTRRQETETRVPDQRPLSAKEGGD